MCRRKSHRLLREGSLAHKRLLCFCTLFDDGTNEGGRFDWFAVDPSSDRCRRRSKNPPPDTHLSPFSGTFTANLLSTAVAVGPTIVSLGGIGKGDQCNAVLPNVHAFDTHWVACPPMNHPRLSPYASVIGGKLYVIGGRCVSVSDPCLEVRDPQTLTWGRLAPPPFFSSFDSDFTAFSDEYGKILLDSGVRDPEKRQGGVGRFLDYNVETNTWETFDDKTLEQGLGHRLRSGKAVMVGHTLYWYFNELVAYDLSLKTWFRGPVKGLEAEGVPVIAFKSASPPSLFHFDGNFFILLWLDKTSPGKFLHRVHCTKFRALKTDALYTGYYHRLSLRTCLLDASVVSSRPYIAHGQCGHLGIIDGLLVSSTGSWKSIASDRRSEKEKKADDARLHKGKWEPLDIAKIALAGLAAVGAINLYRWSRRGQPLLSLQ
ncbi:hypothetical protein RJ639_030919 [Escallonia herrerae]|uniref:Kelch repeat-containing protein n=1 Tax=Escallonia herrerae TaxID=1293975 RepID=A0AA88X0J1_9ASTE|nr:hypothetical protein RJ639_030919 [Escallonia herrerae]